MPGRPARRGRLGHRPLAGAAPGRAPAAAPALPPPLGHRLLPARGEHHRDLRRARRVPVLIALKDFVDDIDISREPLPELAPMPAPVRAVLRDKPADCLPQHLPAELFVGVLCCLAALCEDGLGVPEPAFWSLVRAEIVRHGSASPSSARATSSSTCSHRASAGSA
ncbi:ferric iron reductase [Streptomyces sp. NPDC046866]|uniref:ferric iron reductase n=1 Tax=Streptomyces sp. NPDC046866 TaxID=3154921 RepID=UPI0034542345